MLFELFYPKTIMLSELIEVDADFTIPPPLTMILHTLYTHKYVDPLELTGYSLF